MFENEALFSLGETTPSDEKAARSAVRNLALSLERNEPPPFQVVPLKDSPGSYVLHVGEDIQIVYCPLVKEGVLRIVNILTRRKLVLQRRAPPALNG